MKISLIIDARLTGRELPRRLAEARQQVALFQGRGEILVIDDDDIASSLLGEQTVTDYRQVRSRPSPMGRRLNLAASHSSGRMARLLPRSSGYPVGRAHDGSRQR